MYVKACSLLMALALYVCFMMYCSELIEVVRSPALALPCLRPGCALTRISMLYKQAGASSRAAGACPPVDQAEVKGLNPGPAVFRYFVR